MMTNKEILQKANSHISEGDNIEFLKFCTKHIKWNFVGEQVLEGKKAIEDYMNKVYVKPPKFTIKTVFGEDDFVTALGEISLYENETWITYDYCDVWRFEDGKMAELHAFVVKKN
ncbi:nuclear transport factor 2 family protein [Chryseobacterium sp.]|uniref:nuclear transport factor 2 family protein n=1 Tax=Chryseobacterium sp. TaxID=1871047 RepID=UPI00289E2E9D|nr:nuclear transport factor 2 family protein [Chryseobacterium sp.]